MQSRSLMVLRLSTAAIEEVLQSFLALGSIENVLLLHPNPWHFTPMMAHFVTQARQLFFAREQIPSGDQPLGF